VLGDMCVCVCVCVCVCHWMPVNIPVFMVRFEFAVELDRLYSWERGKRHNTRCKHYKARLRQSQTFPALSPFLPVSLSVPSSVPPSVTPLPLLSSSLPSFLSPLPPLPRLSITHSLTPHTPSSLPSYIPLPPSHCIDSPFNLTILLLSFSAHLPVLARSLAISSFLPPLPSLSPAISPSLPSLPL
jgi:hypothetical protein